MRHCFQQNMVRRSQEYLVVGRVVTITEDPAAVAGAGGENPGDIQELPKVLEAVANFQSPPPDEGIGGLAERQGLESIFV